MIPTELPIATATNWVRPNSVDRNVETTYRQRLHPWCVIRLLPNMQRAVISRTRQRNIAEHYLNTLKRLHPEANYVLVFDPV
ncbi:MAG: hypothetical protein SWY16_14725 [Cyanobacteriota bacterium]|nr:hypothetical protein [Cyanobacteriota bacterium]